MAMDFPSSPTNGQVFIPTHAYGSGPIFIYDSTIGGWKRNAGTALPYNHVINPAFQISQENADTATTGTSYYTADQWISFNSPAGHTMQRVLSTTPSGSKYRSRATSIATISNLSWQQSIEGNRIADLNYGTASAEYTVVRLGVKGPAGTYSFGLRGYLNIASFVQPFTIAADVDTELSFAIPPCTGLGTWANDTSIGARININAGTASVGSTTPGVWSNNNTYALDGQTNLGSSAGQVFEVFDVGWYADPNMTGVAPDFQSPHYEDDLDDCLRYWYKAHFARGISVSATAANYLSSTHPVPMRAVPAVTLLGTVFRLYDPGTVNISTVGTSASTAQHLTVNVTNVTGLTVGRAVNTLWETEDNCFVVSARM